jgi:hypothetical protein
MGLILREVDRAGILELGKLGLRAVAVAVRAPWEEIEAPLAKLLEDGMCVHRDDLRLLVIPNFIDAQEAPQSDKARKRAERERARDLAKAKSLSVTAPSQNVTPPSVGVTDGHEDSNPVTSSHSVLCRAVPSHAALGADAANGEPEDPDPELSDADESSPPSKLESGFDLAKRVFAEEWEIKNHRPYSWSPRTGKGSDDLAMQDTGHWAQERGKQHAELFMRHWAKSYVRDAKPLFSNEGHPARFLTRDAANKYGEPKPPASVTRIAKAKTAEPPPLSPEEHRAVVERARNLARGIGDIAPKKESAG